MASGRYILCKVISIRISEKCKHAEISSFYQASLKIMNHGFADIIFSLQQAKVHAGTFNLNSGQVS